MKNPHLLIPALLVLTFGLTACGPSKDQPASGQTTAAASQPAATAPAAPAKASAADLAAGKAVYARTCIACHQANGMGVPGAFPPLYGNPFLAEADPGKIIRIVLHGLQGPLEVKGKSYNSVMPPQGVVLKNHEIAKVLTYVRDTWGEGTTSVSEEAVAQVRDTVQRPTMWTWAELNQP